MAAASKPTRPATVWVQGKVVYLGRWPTIRLAHLARDRALLFFKSSKRLLEEARRLGPASPEELRNLARTYRRKQGTTSRFHGVGWDATARAWGAAIRHKGERLVIGIFDDEVAAAEAVDRLSRYVGDPKLNFPERRLEPASLEELRARRRKERGKQRGKTSRYRGVSHGGLDLPRPWYASISIGGKSINLGGYATEREAAIARDRAALYHYDDPVLNFPAIARRLGAVHVNALRLERDRVRKASKSSRYRGVVRVGIGQWVALINQDRRRHNLGTFSDERLAARAYDAAARRLHKDRARLNFS